MEISEEKLKKLLWEELILRRKLTYFILTSEKKSVRKEKLRKEIESIDLQLIGKESKPQVHLR